MQKGRERYEDPRFRRISSRVLVKSASKIIVVSGFAAFNCPKNVSKALLAEKEMIFANLSPSFLLVGQCSNVVQLRFQGGNKLFGVEIVYKECDKLFSTMNAR